MDTVFKAINECWGHNLGALLSLNPLSPSQPTVSFNRRSFQLTKKVRIGNRTCTCEWVWGQLNELRLNKRLLIVLRQLGEGGYSFVWLAKEVTGGEPAADNNNQYALKKVLASTPEALAAAKQEAEIQQQTKHPCCLPLLDWSIIPPSPNDPTASHTVYLLSPAFPDGTLADELARLGDIKARAMRMQGSSQWTGGPIGSQGITGTVLSTADVLNITKQLCMALDALHSSGFAHRDVKVHNLLIRRPCQGHQQVSNNGTTQNGYHDMDDSYQTGCGQNRDNHSDSSYTAVLMDFGSAGQRIATLSNRTEALQLQENAEAHCTATIRAPELWDVPSPATLDQAAADMWGVGCTLYAMMYGQSPFQLCLNQGGSLALAIMNGTIPWPREAGCAYPAPLHDLVTRCLSLDPARRPTAAGMAADVSRLLTQTPSLPNPPEFSRYAEAMKAEL